MATTTLEVKGLGKGKLGELAREARRLGVTPGQYVKSLVEERLEITRAAREKTFAEITGPGREVDETELDRLVEAARERHHQRLRKKR